MTQTKLDRDNDHYSYLDGRHCALKDKDRGYAYGIPRENLKNVHGRFYSNFGAFARGYDSVFAEVRKTKDEFDKCFPYSVKSSDQGGFI